LTSNRRCKKDTPYYLENSKLKAFIRRNISGLRPPLPFWLRRHDLSRQVKREGGRRVNLWERARAPHPPAQWRPRRAFRRPTHPTPAWLWAFWPITTTKQKGRFFT